ncbi:FERM domain-containing protein 6 [Liparis tanakae]|uniref:FERM domain-containing protein 6 n=1 Tax=Liparis tanakae TaxID=230148 RepID=A0A4Z2HDT2_9TELE|nr:FERM domain-containing protein 6 [Liparis tanakae]
MSTSIKQERTICVLLPNKDQLDITVGPKSTGQDVFNRVAELLGIKQLHFFGLTVVRDNEHIFLDMEEKLTKYFPKEWKQDFGKGILKRPLPLVLCLKVQYYIENGRLVCERKARHLYYSDLRERVLRSECRQQEEVYFQLAGYALQADLGDHPMPSEDMEVTPYFGTKEYFPPWIVAKRGLNYLLCHGPKVHQELWGMSTRDAMLLFIKEACRLEDVPVTFYKLQKDKKAERGTAMLGLTLRGMQVYQEVNNMRQLLYDFPWSNVGRLTFLGKKFEIQPDGLPSARNLVYYTGSSFRSRHLLLHLSSSHRLYLSLQPALKRIRQLEESEADARQHGVSTEMTSAEETGQRHAGKSSGSASSSRTSGFDTGSKARIDDEGWKEEEIKNNIGSPKEVLVDDPDEMFQLADLLEGLSVDISELSSESCSPENKACPLNSDEELWKLRNKDVLKQCLPLLAKVSTEAGQGTRCRETTAAACRLVSVCVPLCDDAVPGRLALSVLPSLQLSEEEAPGPGRLGVEVASEVVAALLPSLSADEQLTVLSSALSCIKTLPDSLVSKITVRLLLTVLKCCSGARLTRVLQLVLEDMCRWHCADRTPVVTERTLLCLTALSDHLLKPRRPPPSSSAGDLDPRLCAQFWRMLQDGLTHRDCVSRKRALYLLKMCVSLSEEEGLDCPLSPSEEGITCSESVLLAK